MPAERVCFWFSLLGQVCCRALQLRTNSEENGHTARQDAKWGTLQKVFEIQALRRFACCPCQLGITSLNLQYSIAAYSPRGGRVVRTMQTF